MKSFKNYLVEADYTRFLKKNRNLSDDERDEINKYFSKENSQAGSKIKWQSKEVKNMNYDDFLSIMIKYKSGFRKKLKVKVPGRQGEDYWQVRLKTKGFLAYIPLNQETAQFFNSGKFGTCETGHCIGWHDDPAYWDEHMIDSQEVPVYVVDGYGKWVVIIEDGNRDYQVWDKMNQKDISIKDREPIPDFSIKKELMNSKIRKLYDDIREEFYTDDNRHEEAEPDFTDAQGDWDNIIGAMEQAQNEYESNVENFEAEMEDIRQKTLEVYGKKRDEAAEISDRHEYMVDEIAKSIESVPDSMRTGGDDFAFNGYKYNIQNMRTMLKSTKDKFDEAFDEYTKWNDGYDEIDGMDSWGMVEHYDDYEWEGEVPDEDGRYSYVEDITSYPNQLSWWDDYAEYAENYAGVDINSDDVKQAIWSYVFEGYPRSAEEALHKEGLYRP